MSSTAPITVLVILGVLIAVLGLFVAGNIVMVSLGLVTVLAAGILSVVAGRAS